MPTGRSSCCPELDSRPVDAQPFELGLERGRLEPQEPRRSILTVDPPAGAHVRVTSDMADGWLCPPVAPWLRTALNDASQRTFGKPAEFAGEGGTIPFLAVLGEKFPAVQFVATGVLGPGSNAHGIDEMLDLPTVVHVTNAMAHVIAAHARHAADGKENVS